MEFFTLGVYNSTEREFFEKLSDAAIDTFCDIRQRRGVRGADYSFVNSRRLQERLDALGIAYVYKKDLAPTTEMRELQRSDDLRKGEAKRSRDMLGAGFCDEYRKRILDRFNFDEFIVHLQSLSARRIVLFCVEARPQACHRSLLADRLKRRYGYSVIDL